MPQRLPPSQRQFPGLGGQLVAAIFGLIVVVSFITLGFVIFLVLLIAGSAFWLIFLVRRWWLTRGRPPSVQRPQRTRRAGGDTLEGEFEIVDGTADEAGAETGDDSKG